MPSTVRPLSSDFWLFRLFRLVPLHRGFDDLLGAGPQRWQALGFDDQFDAAGDTWSASDQAGALKRQHHLVNRRRRDVEVALHIGLGGRPTHHQGVRMDKGQVLALLFAEARRTCAVDAA